MRVDQITPETLDEVARQWQEDRIDQVFAANVAKFADEVRDARAELEQLEMRLRIRIMRLHFVHGFESEEIASLVKLPVREINKWLKGKK